MSKHTIQLNCTAHARAERIRTLLKKASSAFLEIARELRVAKDQLTKDEFKQFLEEATLTTAQSDKLLKIADTQFLYSERASKQLCRIDGWTVLYEITKIKSDRVDEFFKSVEVQTDQQISRSFIRQFQELTPNSSDDLVTVATINVSKTEALRLDQNQFYEILEHLNEAQRIIDASFVAVQMKQNQKSLKQLESTLFNQTINENDDLSEADELFSNLSVTLETTEYQSL